MRSTLSLGALALASLQIAEALRGALPRRFRQNAEQGLLPDGTPMQLTDAKFQSLKASLRPAAANQTPEKISPEYVELSLDHFGHDEDAGSFFNRYWVSQAAYKPGGPVFLYDVGEADAEPNALFRLQNETSFFKQFVDKYNGIGIVWEHRYYGNSSPVNIDLDTPAEAFKYLTTEQSLADVQQFADQFKRKNISVDLTPAHTPWVFVGGSYPGMRAAFMRKFYPDTIHASFASSAPVEARNDMSIYFEPVWQGMNAYGWGNCTRDIQAAIRYMDKVMENPTASAKLKEQFLGLGAANNSNPTFADALTTPFYLWQSYGVEGGSQGLRTFCNWIEKDPATNKTAPAEGWAASKGANFTVNRWAKFPYFVDMVNGYMTTNCSGSSTKYGDCNLDLRFEEPDSISWTWQYCTQWGFLQSANLGSHQLVSKYNSLSHQKDICHRQFPNADPSLLPDWPRVNKTNEHFGGWDIRPSNVYWSGGQFDPWRTLSPLSDQPDAPHPKTFTTPPQCGQEQDVDDIFGYVMANAEHAFDFRTTFAGGAISRKYFTDALDQWLKCYEPKR